MQLGTNEEIQTQEMNLQAAHRAVMEAKLRLRALKGEPLLQSGDSFSAMDLGEFMGVLSQEFGSRNLRAM